LFSKSPSKKGQPYAGCVCVTHLLFLEIFIILRSDNTLMPKIRCVDKKERIYEIEGTQEQYQLVLVKRGTSRKDIHGKRGEFPVKKFAVLSHNEEAKEVWDEYIYDDLVHPPAVLQTTYLGLSVGGEKQRQYPVLESIWVEARVRRRGLGRLSMMAIEDYSRAEGFDTLIVRDPTTDAIRFYASLGYLPVEVNGVKPEKHIEFMARRI
jgi:GNAT superfamily N-acetyltransferase